MKKELQVIFTIQREGGNQKENKKPKTQSERQKCYSREKHICIWYMINNKNKEEEQTRIR